MIIEEDVVSFALSRRAAMRGVVAAATAAVVAPAVLGRPRAARASLPGAPGRITYRKVSAVWIADADGSAARELVPSAWAGSGGWAPDGSRFVFPFNPDGPQSIRADGTNRNALTPGTTLSSNEPVYTPDGRYVVYSTYGRLLIASSSGTWSSGAPLFDAPGEPGLWDSRPAVAGDGTIVFQRHLASTAYDYETGDIYRVDGDTAVTRIIQNGWGADFAPDSTRIAFVRTYGQHRQIWIADADGGNQVQLTTEENAGSTHNQDPAWSPAGDAMLFTSYTVHGDPQVKRMDLATKTVVTVAAYGSLPTWQPVTTNVVERVWGQTALDTAVATSRYNWADHGVDDGVRGPAKAVVLSRDDVYLDALGGSALAVRKQGPLLITPPGGLHASTRAELQRILAPGGTVYLLGGTVALSAKVESQVTALGYTVVRLWGATEYDTAIAIAKEIEPRPNAVILATALQYYDALAAGAAAGANPGTVIVLTAGDTMPAATAAYLNSLNPDPNTGTRMIGVGGPGVRALLGGYQADQMPSWPDTLHYWPVFGATEFETAAAVADFFFDAPRTAAVATATTWFDALTGGAMVGANHGPLLLSAPGTLSPATLDYLSRNAASLKYATMLGGVLALKDTLVSALGDAVSAPGAYTYVQYTEHFVPQHLRARSLAGGSQERRVSTAAGMPGVVHRPPARATH
ncbi:cell wall-binding repeat-containing protein [Dactylosporangium aurantiacum]|uniref:Cell wall-binding repeat-containing protein n=2 Tax=Dactylosporangium aurantiacum TaxID=35754 RepID=A0A9Q9MN70_9ACTN|nr:cell wall-binding repeat-containing protein [Dactylosporangium aurantiacum]UWZ58976.1 cell wall-binding repeat-containing protein [Dactylosporangium aurantiacum]